MEKERKEVEEEEKREKEKKEVEEKERREKEKKEKKKEKKRLAKCVFLFFLKKNIFMLGLTIFFLKIFLGTSSCHAPAARRQGIYASSGWRGRGESA